MIYPANSLINRTISGALYEVHLNSMGRFINRAVRAKTVTPKKLWDTLCEIYAILGKGGVLEKSGITEDELYETIEVIGMNWKIRPYDEEVLVATVDKATEITEKVFGFRKLALYNNGIEVSDKHVVGDMFMMRLMHDRLHTLSGCSIPRRDTRGHIVDKSTTKKDGRGVYGDKPAKICILTLHKILGTASNEACAVICEEEEKLYGTHELTESVGFVIESTKPVKNRQEYIAPEEEEDN